jgi:hypothetical protein
MVNRAEFMQDIATEILDKFGASSVSIVSAGNEVNTVYADKAESDRQKGSVTAEFALALPIVVVLLSIIVTFISAGTTRLKCIDTASVIARKVAIMSSEGVAVGENVSEFDMLATDDLGQNASVELIPDGEVLRVKVSTGFLPGPLNLLPATVSGTATAYLGNLAGSGG